MLSLDNFQASDRRSKPQRFWARSASVSCTSLPAAHYLIPLPLSHLLDGLTPRVGRFAVTLLQRLSASRHLIAAGASRPTGFRAARLSWSNTQPQSGPCRFGGGAALSTGGRGAPATWLLGLCWSARPGASPDDQRGSLFPSSPRGGKNTVWRPIRTRTRRSPAHPAARQDAARFSKKK